MPRKLLITSIQLLLVCLMALGAGCGGEEATYTEVKQSKPDPGSPAQSSVDLAHSHEHSAPKPGPGFAYTLPGGWSEQEASSMKLLSLAVGEPPEQISELSVSAFPGDVGGKLANVNRWRRQVGLGPISPDALDGFIAEKQISGMPAWEVDFAGPPGGGPGGGTARVVVRAVEHDGKTWFFKLAGSDAAISGQLEAYEAFLGSVAF